MMGRVRKKGGRKEKKSGNRVVFILRFLGFLKYYETFGGFWWWVFSFTMAAKWLRKIGSGGLAVVGRRKERDGIY